tara:strand:- start:5249 stop:6082 length:834 start_codon:yes stop_codon:yes gene_type:complete
LTFVIAEIGINHNGNIKNAKKLIDIAVEAKCDAVKFQKRTVEKVYSKEILDSPRESPWGKTQREQKNGLEFSLNEYEQINSYCNEKNIPWFASCWDMESQSSMRKFSTRFNKVASAMLVHKKLLEMIAEERKHTFISTGMSTMQDIEAAVKIFRDFDCPFELMHTHSTYPMPIEEANLNLIPALRKKFECDVGYSGHETSSYLLPIVAVTLGATSIERHITLDRAMYGSDQAASLEKAGLIRMVRDIREIDKVLGDGEKRVWDSEIPAQRKLREKLV